MRHTHGRFAYEIQRREEKTRAYPRVAGSFRGRAGGGEKKKEAASRIGITGSKMVPKKVGKRGCRSNSSGFKGAKGGGSRAVKKKGKGKVLFCFSSSSFPLIEGKKKEGIDD